MKSEIGFSLVMASQPFENNVFLASKVFCINKWRHLYLFATRRQRFHKRMCGYVADLSYHAQILLAENGLFGQLLLRNHGVYVHVCLQIV